MSEFISRNTDDKEDNRSNERSERPAPAPVGSEGVLFERERVRLRPLLDVINEEKPPAPARSERMHALVGAEVLPSVSSPSQPELRTYLPPMLEAAQPNALKVEGVNEDDDSDTEESSEEGTTAVAATPTEATPTEAPQAEMPSLRDQFEDIMRQAVGEDYGHQLAQALPENDDKNAHIPAGDDVIGRSAPTAYAAPVARPVVPMTEMPAHSVAGPAEYAPTSFASSPDHTVEASTPSGPQPPSSETGMAAGGPSHGPEEVPTDDDGSAGVPPFRRRFSGGFGPGSPTYNANSALGLTGNRAPIAPTVERDKNHNGLWFVAGFITGWVVKQHLANKKLERMQKEADTQIGQQRARMEVMAGEQRDTQYKLDASESQVQQQRAEEAARELQSRQAVQRAEAATQQARDQLAQQRFEQPAAQQPTTPGEQQRPAFETPLTQAGTAAERPFGVPTAETAIAPGMKSNAAETGATTPANPEQAQKSAKEIAEELVAQAYDLQDGQHVEHATGGGHNTIVDKHGHVVEGAIQYGEEFKFQQRQEQAKGNAFTTQSHSSTGGGGGQGPIQPAAQGYSYTTNNITTGLQSGQLGNEYGLPLGTPSPTARQRLLASKKQNPVVATVASPWLWAAIIVLLAAFFTAAFI